MSKESGLADDLVISIEFGDKCIAIGQTVNHEIATVVAYEERSGSKHARDVRILVS